MSSFNDIECMTAPRRDTLRSYREYFMLPYEMGSWSLTPSKNHPPSATDRGIRLSFLEEGQGQAARAPSGEGATERAREVIFLKLLIARDKP